MPESSLSLTYQQLEAEVGFQLGWGRGTNYGETAWNARQQQGITDCVSSGVRSFYFPQPLPGEQSSYDWSFIRPTRELVLVSGANDLQLPDDFGGLEGDIRLIDSGRAAWPIRQTSEQIIFQKRFQFPTQTGQPQFCAIGIPETTGVYKGQRPKLIVFPTADADYTLQIQYYLLPEALSATSPYALGGATHSETIKAAVKAAAELHQDNQKGPMNELFIDRLRASIALDRRNKPQTMGYNSDPGFNRDRYGYRFTNNVRVPITYQGLSSG